MSDFIICADCGNEAAETSEEEAELCGWDVHGEYGARCPECASSATPAPQGIDTLAEALGLEKK